MGRHAVWLTRLSLVGAIAAGLWLTPSWFFWAGFLTVLLTITGWRHASVLDEGAPLGIARWILTLAAIVVLVIVYLLQ